LDCLLTYFYICSAKELEHFERIRRTFESATTQKREAESAAIEDGSRTIGEAVDGLEAGSEITSNGITPNGNIHESAGKGKGKQVVNGSASSRSNSGNLPTLSKSRGNTADSVGGRSSKGKGKAPVRSVEGDSSDSSFDGYQVNG
jgi:peroxin-6